MVAVVLVLVGCGGDDDGSGDASGGDPANLRGQTFLSESVTEGGEPRPLVADTRISLGFRDGNVTAEAGCNHLSAPVRLDGGRLATGEVTMTKKRCDEPLHDQDAWLADFLSADPRWALDGRRLTLRSDGTTVVLSGS